ncbi:MAG: hypothetical protein MR439_01370, partial [Clostridium sp.]|nr:hypothetical protein [Clostridium sp.]
MKKIFLGIFLCLIFLTGCGKKSEGDVLKSYTSAVEKAKSYYLNGKMELVNNEDVYTYDISVSYEADDNYKIELVNTVNNHEQVILRNSEGVYVVTPSLNKSFKFQSDWPYNNSQVYLLSSLLDDINNDEERVFETKDNEYVFTTRVNYPNSPKLEKQKIYFNANNLPTRVEVLDKDGNVEIKMVFNKIDLKADFNDTYFDLSSILDTEVKEENNEEQQNTETETKETATIDDIIYPMYLPTNTYLANQEKVKVDNGERLILTFAGDSSFVLVEETVSITNSPEIIPTYGEVELIG